MPNTWVQTSVEEVVRLTDEDVIVRRVGEDDGLSEQARGVVHGGRRTCPTGEGNATVVRPRRRGRSVGQAGFSLR